jgi:hypothetical protein
LVTEEASVRTPHHETTIQLLECDRGEKAIRSCAYEGDRMGRCPLAIGAGDLEALEWALRKNKQLHALMRSLVG